MKKLLCALSLCFLTGAASAGSLLTLAAPKPAPKPAPARAAAPSRLDAPAACAVTLFLPLTPVEIAARSIVDICLPSGHGLGTFTPGTTVSGWHVFFPKHSDRLYVIGSDTPTSDAQNLTITTSDNPPTRYEILLSRPRN